MGRPANTDTEKVNIQAISLIYAETKRPFNITPLHPVTLHAHQNKLLQQHILSYV